MSFDMVNEFMRHEHDTRQKSFNILKVAAKLI